MKTHHYILPLKPLPFPVQEPKNKFYDTNKHIRNSYIFYLEQQHGDKKPLQGALSVHREFYFPVPDLLKNRPQTEEMWMLTVPSLYFCTKLLYESMKIAGVIKDEKYICVESGMKKFSKTPRIVITITELK